MSNLVIKAPFSGWALPLDQVDDPVFAEKMMGDGIAIEPLGNLVVAPAAGEVVAVASTGHSVTIRLENGAELLIHVGLDTVALDGAGFEVQTRIGAKVAEGEPLISLDLDRIAREARSLVTPILIVSDDYRLAKVRTGCPVDAGYPIFEVEKRAGGQLPTNPQEASHSAELAVPLPHGIHARPAARIAAALKGFQADVRIGAHGREANARSTVALLTVGIKKGDRIAITGSGPEAEAAVLAVRNLILSGMDEVEALPGKPVADKPQADTGPVFRGVCAAPGLAVGRVQHLRAADPEVPEDGDGPETERSNLHEAVRALRQELSTDVAAGPNGVAFAHRSILDDPELMSEAEQLLEQGRSAAFAWRSATRGLADRIRATGDAFLIERIDDLIDVERRLLAMLVGSREPDDVQVEEGAVVLADTLLPSQFMTIANRNIGAVVTARGGPTSHVAILAASAGIPMLVAVGDGLLAVADGTEVIVDAAAGTIDTQPGTEALADRRGEVASLIADRAQQRRDAVSECVMADGTRIEVFANLGSVEDAHAAVSQGAEGCGLLRTEFLFLDRPTAPSEEEQREAYAAVASALQGRPLIIRTLDVGGDKQVPYLDLAQEENPALGERGVRFSLRRQDLLSAQLRAILAAVPAAQCRIMLPMIVDVAEFRQVKSLLDEAANVVGATARVPLGVMIETPSAALLSRTIAAEADFLSVGTNDLSQYALAVDRGNPAVAHKVDALHPAVLRLIAMAAQGASENGRWTGVCGGLASEPEAATILIGLGVTELSAVPAAVPAVKAAVRKLTMDKCKHVARLALELGTAAEVRAMLKDHG